jgi:hypothetical protein
MDFETPPLIFFHLIFLFFTFLIYISRKRVGKFELITSISLSVIHNKLNYLLETDFETPTCISEGHQIILKRMGSMRIGINRILKRKHIKQ